MKISINNLKVLEGVWSDPGEAFCGAGAALPNRPCVEEIVGNVIVRFDSSSEMDAARRCEGETYGKLLDLLASEQPAGIKVIRWTLNQMGAALVCQVEDFDASNWQAPDRGEE